MGIYSALYIIESISLFLFFFLTSFCLKQKLQEKMEAQPRELHIFDLGFDILEKIFRTCPAPDRARLRRVCTFFSEVFYHAWGHVKGIRGTIARTHQLSLVRYLFRHAGRYLTHFCLRIDENFVEDVLKSATISERLTVLCLENINYSRDGPLQDHLMKTIFEKNQRLKRIFLRGFRISGSCFGSILFPERIKFLKLVGCHELCGVVMEMFLKSTTNLEEFSTSDCTGISNYNRHILGGLILSGCKIRKLYLDGIGKQFDKHLITQLFRRQQSIQKIHLSNYKLTSANIELLPSLREISLDNVILNSGTLLQHQNKFTQTTLVSLTLVHIDNNFLRVLKNMNNLKTLEFINSSFDITCVGEGSMANLESLYIGECSGVSQLFINDFVQCRRLKNLAYRQCQGIPILLFL